MKNYYRTVLSVAIISMLLITALFFMSVKTDAGKRNASMIIELNDIVKTLEEGADVDSSDISSHFVINDPDGNTIYDSEGGSSNVTVTDAIASDYPYQYVIRDGRIAGSVIIVDDGVSRIETLRNRIVVILYIAVLILFIAAMIFGKYVENNIFIPFRRMKGFAEKVARGQLDEPLPMDRNNLFGDFSESFDIMREELLSSKERELSLQKKEREMIASLSHDLKTPITGIKLTTELLETKASMSDSPDPSMLEKLNNIYIKADQIDKLVSDLFESALNELGEFTVNLTDEKSGIIDSIVRSYDDKELTNCSDIPDVLINIDSKRLSQVIGNIISNSYKYADTRIDVDYKVEGRFLEMTLRDYGPGVPEDEIELITNKFYRGKDSKTVYKDGNGLGLYIGKILMEKMNGELIPGNADPSGFCVRLLIPLS